MDRAAGIAVLSFLVATQAVLPGCLGMFALYEAEVPEAFIRDGWREEGRDRGGSWLGEGYRWSQVVYEVRPSRGLLDDGPYPASLAVMSIDTPAPLPTADVIANLEEQVRMNAGEQGVELREGTRRAGDRALASGITSTWFTYEARIGSGASLFTPGHDAKVMGEAFYDGRTKITVVVVGLAQVQGGSIPGQYHRDDTHWHRMVADPEARIATPASSDGMVYNVRSHDP